MAMERHLETPGRIEPCGFEEKLPDSLTSSLEVIEKIRLIPSSKSPDEVERARQHVRIENAHFSMKLERMLVPMEAISTAVDGGQVEDGLQERVQAALAHIAVETWIDELFEGGEMPVPTDVDFLREIHRRLYEGMPASMRVTDGIEIVPGEFRKTEVAVGRHQPPSADRIVDFMNHFAWRYRGLTAGARGKVLHIPAAHHRFSYIHPFQDGNGRVARLMTHAMLRRADLDENEPWSISKALASPIDPEQSYHVNMDIADARRQGDRDGRGNLSLWYLEFFTNWFLDCMSSEMAHACSPIKKSSWKPSAPGSERQEKS